MGSNFNVDIPLNGKEKQDTCEHRSEKLIEGMIIKPCCKERILAYRCIKRNIYPLIANHCATCREYKRKCDSQ